MTIPKNFVFMKNLPTKKPKSSKYDSVADACRRHPGMWTIFNHDVSYSMTAALKKQFPGFEFASRANSSDGNRTMVTIYGRFVGEVDLELQALLDED